MILVEVRMLSLRQKYYDDHRNDKGLKLDLDCLLEVRDDAAQRMALYHQRMTKYYNQKVKLRRFNFGDMVLRKVSHATKDLTQRKLGPNWKRELLLRRYGWESFTLSLESRTPQEVLSIKVPTLISSSTLNALSYSPIDKRDFIVFMCEFCLF